MAIIQPRKNNKGDAKKCKNNFKYLICVFDCERRHCIKQFGVHQRTDHRWSVDANVGGRMNHRRMWYACIMHDMVVAVSLFFSHFVRGCRPCTMHVYGIRQRYMHWSSWTNSLNIILWLNWTNTTEYGYLVIISERPNREVKNRSRKATRRILFLYIFHFVKRRSILRLSYDNLLR